MKKSLIVLVALVMGVFQYAQAQYVQGRPATEYMFKIEAGYMPFVTNIFEKAESGYILANQEHAAGLNIMNGWNISQDFFLGFGVGYACLSPLNDFSKMSHNALVFVDFDFRPLQDEFAPMIGARIGGSAMIPTGEHEFTLGPYAEVYGGLNWYYRHRYSNMERNYHSWYVELGVAYMYRTILLPIRIGWRL